MDCLTVSLPESGLVKPGNHRLVLKKVSPLCQGRYTCQVTGGSPPFHTAVGGGSLAVSILPPPGHQFLPILQGIQSTYQMGQHIRVTCQTSKSFPPASIQWTFNGAQVPAYSSSVSWTDSGLAMSRSSLVIRLSSPSLPSTLSIKCTSTIGTDYTKEVKRTVKFTSPSKPVLGEPLVSSKACRSLLGLHAVLVWTALLVRNCHVGFEMCFIS